MTHPAEIYRVEGLPIFQNHMFHTAEAAIGCTRGDVVLTQDPATGLISNSAFDASLLDYGADYQNEQAVSGAFLRHLDDVSAIVTEHMGGGSIIEVGCGKGHFFEHLQKMGFRISGMDPAYEGDNPAIRKEYFSKDSGVTADGLILRHVLEHIQDPVSFLRQLSEANGGQGKIYIEVPCLDWIGDNRAWFDVFYEHVNYFRLQDLAGCFSHVHHAGRTFGGQYLSVVADLASVRAPTRADEPLFAFPGDFTGSITGYAKLLKDRAAAPAGSPRRQMAIWGGASKGVTFAIYMQRLGAPVEMVVDINASKQGRYLPGSGLRVHSPAEAMQTLADGSLILIMNPNYAKEIKEMTGGRFEYLVTDSDVSKVG